MLAGAIILIPTEGGKQIAFALLISTICLYTSLRTSPYIIENLLKLHIMSLTAQCITLFYALLLEIQNLSSVAEVCVDGKDCGQQNTSDAIMESLLSLLQVSVFLLPVVLLLRDRGVFDAVGNAFKRVVKEAHKGAAVCTGHTAVETKKVRWPSRHDDSASTSHLRSRKKSLDQPLETTYSSRKRTTARGATPQAARRLRTTDCSVHPVEDEITIHVEEIQGPQVANPVAIKMQRPVEIPDLSSVIEGTARDCDNIAVERSKFFAEYGELSAILAQSTRPRLSRLAQSMLHDAEYSATPSSLPFTWKGGDAGIALKECDVEVNAVLHAEEIQGPRVVAAASDETLVENSSLYRDGEASSGTATVFLHHAFCPGPPVSAIDDSSALVQCALGDALCGNGCFGEDAQVTHWSHL